MFLWLVVLIAIVVAVWWSSRVNELFYLSVRGSRILLVRGRIPSGLLNDFKIVLASPPVVRASIRAFRAESGARLAITGIPDGGRVQRLRNVFNVYPKSRLRAAPRSDKRTITQILGIVWVAWLVERLTRNTWR